MWLWLDTSHHVDVGFLDKEFNWIERKSIQSTKAATTLHEQIHSLLEHNQLSIDSIKGTIQIAGPGAYTGMRVSDGILKFFQFKKLNSLSFYHYDVPRLLDVNTGLWVANAFKGEIFVYFWEGLSSQTELMTEADFFSKYSDSKLTFYTHNLSAFSPSFQTKNHFKFEETSQLIQTSYKKLFKKVEELNLQETIYYYRSNEVEFKKPN